MKRLLILGYICYSLGLPSIAQSQDRAALVTREGEALQTIAREPSHKLVLWLGDGAPYPEHRDLFDKAFAACRQALRASPDNAAVRANLGALYLWRDALHRDESGNFEKAIDQFLIVLSNDPGNDTALTYLRTHEVLTRVATEIGEKGMENIQSALRQTLKGPPNAPSLRTFARVMFFDRRLGEARTAAEALTALAPNASSQLLLGSVELKSSHADKALAAFQTALKLTLDPLEVATAKLGAAQAYQTMGKIDDADRMLAEATTLLPPLVLSHAAQVAGLETPAQLGWSIGRAYSAAGNVPKALDFLDTEEVGRLSSEMATEKNNEGVKLFEAKNLLGARNAFLIAGELIPSKAIYWNNLASVSFEMGRYRDCLMAYRKAEALEPLKKVIDVKQFAISYAVLGDYRNARSTFEKAARNYQDSKTLGRMSSNTWAVALAYAVGGWDEAVSTWSRLIKNGNQVQWNERYDVFVHVWVGIRFIGELAQKQGARYQSIRHDSLLYQILGEGLRRSLSNKVGTKEIRQDREDVLNRIINNYRRLPLKPVIPPDVQALVQNAQPFVDAAVDNQESGRKAVVFYKQIIEKAPWWPEGHLTLALLAGGGGSEEDDYGRLLESRVWVPEREINTYIALLPDGPDTARARQMLEGFRKLRIPLGPDIER